VTTSPGQRVRFLRKTSARNSRLTLAMRVSGWTTTRYAGREIAWPPAGRSPPARVAASTAKVMAMQILRTGASEVGARLGQEDEPVAGELLARAAAVELRRDAGGPVHVVGLELEEPVEVE